MTARSNSMINLLSQLVNILPKAFLLHNEARKGHFANCHAILWIVLLVGITRMPLSGFNL